jgi:hypothetical protein
MTEKIKKKFRKKFREKVQKFRNILKQRNRDGFFLFFLRHFEYFLFLFSVALHSAKRRRPFLLLFLRHHFSKFCVAEPPVPVRVEPGEHLVDLPTK